MAYARSKVSTCRRLIAGLMMTTALSIAAGAPAALARGSDPAASVPAARKAESASFATSFDTDLVINLDRSAEKTTTMRLKVLGEAALQSAGQQVLKYVEGMETLDILEAYTEKADGQKVPVDPSNIITRDATSGITMLYLDAKARTVIFPDLEVGDTVVLKTREKQTSGIFPGQYSDQYHLARTFPYGQSTLRITAPKALHLQVAAQGEGLESQTVEEGDNVRYLVTYHPQPRVQAEPGATSNVDRDPRILISTFKSYEDIGRAYWTEAAPRAVVTPEIRALADEITRGIDGKREQAAAIDAWVKRNIRYVAVYFGTARVVPNPAAKVMKNKYGDCKDHVTLMSALLAAKGIESEQVLIQSGSIYTLAHGVPVSYFNHVIIYLPEFDLYDDPTAGFAGFGVLSPATYDKPVIRMSANGVYRARTPVMRPEDHVVTNHTTMFVAADGTVTGDTTEQTTGVFAMNSRYATTRIQHLGAHAAAEAQLRANGTTGKGEFKIGSPSNYSEPFVIRGHFTLDNRVKTEPGSSAPIPIGLVTKARPGEALFGKRYAGRTQPFVCYSGRQVQEIEMTFADGLALPRPINGRRIENRWFSYNSDYRLENRTLKIRREFEAHVPGQVCGPSVEAAIGGGLKMVYGSVRTRLTFAPAPSASRQPQTPERPAKVSERADAGATLHPSNGVTKTD